MNDTAGRTVRVARIPPVPLGPRDQPAEEIGGSGVGHSGGNAR